MTKCRSVVKNLIDLGIDPFGKRFERSATASELKSQWDEFSKEELHDKKMKVMFRLPDV